jgi:hypothetical protein
VQVSLHIKGPCTIVSRIERSSNMQWQSHFANIFAQSCMFLKPPTSIRPRATSGNQRNRPRMCKVSMIGYPVYFFRLQGDAEKTFFRGVTRRCRTKAYQPPPPRQGAAPRRAGGGPHRGRRAAGHSERGHYPDGDPPPPLEPQRQATCKQLLTWT